MGIIMSSVAWHLHINVFVELEVVRHGCTSVCVWLYYFQKFKPLVLHNLVSVLARIHLCVLIRREFTENFVTFLEFCDFFVARMRFLQLYFIYLFDIFNLYVCLCFLYICRLCFVCVFFS